MKEATRVSINLLARREHSDFELRRKLKNKGFDTHIIDETLKKLIAKSYLSNSRFIENYIQVRRAKGYGPQRIQVELSARGITTDVIEQYLKVNDENWLATARDAWKKKYKSKLPRNYKERAQQLRFLQYRGFTNDQLEFILQSDFEHA